MNTIMERESLSNLISIWESNGKNGYLPKFLEDNGWNCIKYYETSSYAYSLMEKGGARFNVIESADGVDFRRK